MNLTISNDGVEPARVVSRARYLEISDGIFRTRCHVEIKTVVERKATPGEVGGKRAASCARYLDKDCVRKKGRAWRSWWEAGRLTSRYLEALMAENKGLAWRGWWRAVRFGRPLS